MTQYVELKMGDKLEPGDECTSLFGKNKEKFSRILDHNFPQFATIGSAPNDHKRRFRRPIKDLEGAKRFDARLRTPAPVYVEKPQTQEPEFVTLNVGDTIEEGDECSYRKGPWGKVSNPTRIGTKIANTGIFGDADKEYDFRRPVKKPATVITAANFTIPTSTAASTIWIEGPPVEKTTKAETLTEAVHNLSSPMPSTIDLMDEVKSLKNKLRETEVAVSVYKRLQELLGVEGTVVIEVKELLQEEKLLHAILRQI